MALDEFEGGHEAVNHSKKEYVRGDVHSNTVEGFFSTVIRRAREFLGDLGS